MTIARCLTVAVMVASVLSCRRTQDEPPRMKAPPPHTSPNSDSTRSDDDRDARMHMVDRQLFDRGIVNPRVLSAMQRVPRHEFVPQAMKHNAYDDTPLPIGYGQTISQPYIVALMTQLVVPQPHMKALDIGTGSGYQAAVLAELVKSVYSIEIVEPLAVAAALRLKQLHYDNVQVRHGDGYHGWEDESPFDIIVVAAAPDHLPPALVEQLAVGGKMVIPVGSDHQSLLVVQKDADGNIHQQNVVPVAFVPMTGEAQDND